MRIAVLGAGVVGVTCAWELMRDGHEVVLVDRERHAALGTSYGNAGFISPGHAYAWASPKAPGILLKSLYRGDQALRFRPSLDPALWRWMAKFLGQCNTERAAWNTARKVALCVYSKQRLNVIAEETGIAFDHLRQGCIYLFRSQAGLEAGARKARILIDQGVAVETVDMNRAAELDPALGGVRDRFAGALFTPEDETGDCHTFVQRLAEVLADRGAELRYGTTVRRIEVEGDRAARVVTDRGDIVADAYVLSLGTASPRFGGVAGVDLPIYPVKGYSMTAPVAGRNRAPTLGGIDEENLIAWARYGDRVRVTATAEFAGHATTWTEADFRHMDRTVRELFPDGADWDRAERWAGLRPMTPSGLPIYGRGRLRNLWLDTGQGHMGWTMGAGSARITADLIAGRTPEIDTSGMRVGDTRRAA